ncbi:MAG: hypothetical protein ACREU3_13660 [Steroidobacteraceae bacterium]
MAIQHERNSVLSRRTLAGLPFLVLGVAAVIAGGGTAAAVAYHPTEHLIWMVAYLVLVVGVMQCGLGTGQAWLTRDPPSGRVAWCQWALYNLGNAAVIAGTLDDRFDWVACGTVLFAAAIAWFLYGVRIVRWRWGGIAYRVLLGVIFSGSLIGLVISGVANRRW